jgi:hypothetical protein
MAHITAAFYNDEYFGAPAEDQFPRYAARASDDIDITAGEPLNIDALPESQRILVKKATAAQVEWYVQNGDTYNEPQGGGESIGSYSRSGLAGGHSSPSPAALSPRARAYLDQSGLMYRAVRILGAYGYTREDDE